MLYKKNPDCLSSSRVSISLYVNLNLSDCWIGTESDQLKIRIISIKNVPDQFRRNGLFVRLKSVYNNSPTFQSSTQFGEEKRIYNDDFVCKVSCQKAIKSCIIIIIFYRHLRDKTASKSGELSMFQTFSLGLLLTLWKSFLSNKM